MRIKNKIALHFILCAIIIFILMENAKGAIIGVSPGNIDFKNVLRGGYAERPIRITTDSESPIHIEFEAWGEAASWMSFKKNTTISENNPAQIILSVLPPPDIPNGNYTAYLRINTGALGSNSKEEHATSDVKAVIDVVINIEITDVEILSCSAHSFTAQSVEQGDEILFETTVMNNGNIRIKPRVSIEIWDDAQISVVKNQEFRGNEILPTRENKLSFRVPSYDLDFSQYWATINVIECSASDTVTFDVLEEGALKAEGRILRIYSPVAEAEIKNTIPIYVDFENVGEKEIASQFRGQITKDGDIIQILESEKILVPISEITNFTFFFTPQKAGKYIVSGRVFYDKKRTFESSAVIISTPKKLGLQQALLFILYIVILIAIIFLLYKIRKEKRKLAAKLTGRFK